MTPERWQQIEKIFQKALDLKPAERPNYLKKTCKDDSELKKEVEKLLSQFEESSDFIEKPLYQESNASVLASFVQDEERDSLIGNMLGSYKIEREIGRGGMGAVYEAVRADGAFRMRVAIKLIKRGMDTDFILKRFRNERQILATLEHRFITRLIDGGTTDDGRPYFVMDFIEGQPIYEYCDKSRLSIKERLELFCRICEAVDHAHKNMVIHRDLKPSNILVAKDGTPRLLDFGIAKLLDPEMASDTLQPTATAMRMMTVDYASPEQVRGEQVTFSTDIYSLGVILYELLTGHRPYNFRSRLIEHAAQIINEQEPERPSLMVKNRENVLPRKGKKAEEAPTLIMIGRNRHATVEEVSRELEGNLDRIILNALHKAPDDRYASVDKFREDIRRHLEGEDVMAPALLPPQNKASRTQAATIADNSVAVLPFKLLGTVTGDDSAENYLGVGLTDTLITRLSQVGSLIVRPTSSVLVYSEQHTDPFDAATKLGVRYILDGTIRPLGKKLRVSVQLLDATKESAIWAQQIDSDTKDLLTLEDTISEKVAESVLPQITGGERSRLAKRGTSNNEAYEAYKRGRYFWNQFTPETFPKALEAFKKAVELDPNYALAYAGIADYYNWATIFGFYAPREGYQKTRAAAEKALEIDGQLSEAISILGFITAFTDYNWTEAEKLFKQSLELNPNYGLTHEWYSALLAGTGRSEEAYREIMRSLELDPLSLRTVTLTAWTLYQLRRYPEALARIEELFEMNPNYYQAFFQRGNILREMGRAEEAVAAGQKGMALAPGLGYMHYKMCFALASLKRYDEAWKILREYEANSPATEINSYHLGMCYAAVGERETAFKWLNKAVEDRHPWVVWLATDAKLDDFRDDERFNELLRKSNRSHLIKEVSDEVPKTLAVLPFALTGEANEEDKYLSIGLADAVITRLSGLKGIAVRPTTSVLKYANNTTDPYTAGEELKADFLLDGSIERAEGKFRISVRFLELTTKDERWTNEFEEDTSEILEIEDKVSAAVARLLIPELSGDEERQLAKRGTNNAAAYAAYLKGRTHWYNSTPEDLAKALICYSEAVTLDPKFAAPYAGIADYHNFLSILGIMAPHDSFPAAKENAQKALSLDPGLAEAYVSMSVTAMGYDWDFAESERLVKKALELSPNNASTHFWYSNLLTIIGESDRAISEIERAESLSPKTPSIMVSHILSLKNARRFEEAQAKIREAVESHPNHYLVLQTFCWLVKWIGNYDEVEAQCRRAVEITNRQNNPLYAYGYALAVIGKHHEAREIINELEGRRERVYVPPMYFALIYTALGEKDKAFEWLEKSLEERDFWTPWTAVDPRFDELRDDPRYFDLLKRIGHPHADAKKLRGKDDQTVKTSATAGDIVRINPEGFSAQSGISLAVLPFKQIRTLSGESTDQEYLGIGLADSIISRLMNVQRLTVRPTSSILHFEEITNPFDAGKQLSVKYVLDGNIRFVGSSVRVTVQLLRTDDSAAIWSQQFDEHASGIFQLEDRISLNVAEALLPHLGTDDKLKLEKKHTVVPAAYEAYMRGRYHWNKLTPESLFKSAEMFERAIALDPNYAPAYVGIADFHVWLSAIGFSRPDESLKKAKAAAEKALEIDPELIEANFALSSYEFAYEYNQLKGIGLVNQIIKAKPNYWVAHEALAFLYISRLDFEKGIESARMAESLNPLSTRSILTTSWCFYLSGNFADSAAKAREALELDSNLLQGNLNLANALIHLGKPDEAIPLLEQCLKYSPKWGRVLRTLAIAFVAANKREKAEEILANLEETSESEYVSPVAIAAVCVALDKIDEAFEWLEKGYEERSIWMIWLESEVDFAAIRDDARFKDLIKRIKPDKTFEPVISAKKLEGNKYSVAVLPLQFIGEIATGDAYLSVGLADAMITRLSQVRRLVVRPTNSVLRFAETQDSFAAGRELGVDYALCGTIRPAGKRIRISAQLIDIKANSTLWSDKFDEDFGDVLALEDVVAEKVAKLLIPKLTTEEEQRLTKRKTNSPEAYEAYIKGKHHLYLFSPENFEKALFYLNKAIEIDPNYALPYAALSDCYFSLTGFSSRPPGECFPMMESMAKKAVELDDSFGDAYSNLAMIAFYGLDTAEGERLFKKGLELNPNQQSGYIFYSVLLNMLGRSSEAVDVARRAMEFDQTSIFHRMHYTWVLYHSRRFDEAVKEINRSEWVNSDFPHALGVASWIHRHLGNYEQAIEFGERSVKLSPQTSWYLSNLGVCHAKAGNREKALSILKELEERGKNEYLSLYCLAQLHLYLGNKEKAIGLLERSVEEKDVWFPWLTSEPELDPIRNEPRFQRLVNKIQGVDSSEPSTATFRAGVTGEMREQDTAEEPVAKETHPKPQPGFFYRHRYKWATAGVFSVLTFVAYLTGILTVRFDNDGKGLTIETDKADTSKQKDTLPPLAPALTPNSIVILPFTTADAVNNDLGVGLADSLTSKLGAVKRLTVISANSGRAIAKKDKQEISRELGVQYIVTSSIQKSDIGFRVVSELFDGQNDKQMWRADLDIDSKSDELFTVVNKMSEKILEAIKVEALPVEKEQFEKTYTKNGLAYELYLVGRSQMVIRSPETIRKAIAAFNRAKEQDPGFVLAYVGLADAYNMQSLYEIPAPPDSYPNAIENAKKALAIDPELAEAHVSLGYATFFYLRDRTTAELEYRRAIQINPSYAQAHSWFSSFLVATNRLAEAVSEAETAKRLDPMALTSGTGLAYFYNREFGRSIAQAEASLALNPNFIPAIKLLRWNYTSLGKYQEAKTAYLKERSSDLEGSDADWYMIEAQVEALNGNKAEIKAKLDKYVNERSVKDNPNAYAYEIALAYNALGEKEKAFEWLEKAEAARSYGFNFLEVDHRLESLKGDPRFQKLLQKLTGSK